MNNILKIILLCCLAFTACDQTATDEYLRGDFLVDASDTSAPNQLSPYYEEKVLVMQPKLIWTAKNGARNYVVEVATDAAFNNQISGSPFTVDAPETQLALDIVSSTIYWRVRADITTVPAEDLEVGKFYFLGDSIHVNGSSAADEEIGTIDLPFKNIMAGINEAYRAGVRKVKVAAKTGGAPYEELIVIKDGVSILGGYTQDLFEENRDIALNETKIIGSSTKVIMAEAISQSTVIEGFTIETKNIPVAGIDKNGIYVRYCSDKFIIKNNRIIITNTENSTNNGIYFESSSGIVENNYIKTGNSPNANSYAIFISYDRNVTARNNILLPGTGNTSVGISSQGIIESYNNTVVISECTNNCYGITIENGPNILKNNILFLPSGGNIREGFSDPGVPSGTILNNLVFTNGGTDGVTNGVDGNIIADPQLDADYRLTAGSPINALYGGADLSVLFNYDKDGNTRSTGSNGQTNGGAGWSMGAFEY